MKGKSNRMNINNGDKYTTVHTLMLLIKQPLHGSGIYLDAIKN